MARRTIKVRPTARRKPYDVLHAIDMPTVAAVKSMFKGTANAGQQQAFMNWLLVEVCQIPGDQFYDGPDGQRLTDYALGMRGVALAVTRVRDMVFLAHETRGEPREPKDDTAGNGAES